MYKKLLLTVLMCNIFSLSAMSPKELREKKFFKKQKGRKKSAEKKDNILNKKASLNAFMPEEIADTSPKIIEIRNSNGWIEPSNN